MIRKAEVGDASAICRVLIRSVREICAKDYRNDPVILDHWCSNKTPENVGKWISNLDNHSVVAVVDAAVVGVGMINTRSGELQICYVLPEVLGTGVGRALLQGLLEAARCAGLEQVKLGSTITARGFYERHGFEVAKEHWDWTPPNKPYFEMVLKLTR